MGYTTKGSITNFWPDNTDSRIYLEAYMNPSIPDIVFMAREKWGESINLEDITISSEYIHTNCLGYDGFDCSDWTNFLVIEYSL